MGELCVALVALLELMPVGLELSPPCWLVIMLALIGAFFLLREHWSHIAGYWPYLLLLACPLMHLFHGHGGHGSHGGDSSKK